VRAALAKATGRTPLCILLALNCAMNVAALCALHSKDLDLERGLLVGWVRVKKRNRNPRKITYPLWAETLELLKELAKPGEYVLPFRAENALHNKLKRFFERNNLPGSFRRLRKTSATALDNSEFGSVTTYWLGNSPRGVTDKNYARVLDERFGQAVEWLRKHYFGLPEQGGAKTGLT
jgi:integrase